MPLIIGVQDLSISHVAAGRAGSEGAKAGQSDPSGPAKAADLTAKVRPQISSRASILSHCWECYDQSRLVKGS